MRYFEIALLKSSAPILTYSFNEEIEVGSIVKVNLKESIKEGVVLKEVEEPSFETKEIIEVTNKRFSKEQLEVARFISSYYFSSLGEAISLFSPFISDSQELSSIKDRFILPTLTSAQQRALEEIREKNLALLFGVTGSGKTEIYIHLIKEALVEGKSTLLLMPEIALTPQITQRIKSYFGDLVESWHSKLSLKRRQEILKKIEDEEVRVIIGARSALFLPLKRLGLIIVDEEHDDSYKSQSRPRYNAKDLAIYMGKKLNIKVLLGSATPLVTSYYKFPIVRLKEPYKKSRKNFYFIKGDGVNEVVIESLRKIVKRGEQALVFVPTRANFKYLVCQSCGRAQLCPFCSIGMSIHSQKRVLKCHYCNFSKKIPEVCEFCGSEALSSKREGTLEVIEKIKSEIKEAKIIQFDRDFITTSNKLAKALDKINKKEANIIVGTQMLSKGHDYADITLSVILGLDYIVAIGDYRARERAISLLHQIAGRSGRVKDASVLIQTSQPQFFEPFIKDYEIFLRDELEFREIAAYPPFSNLARVLIATKDYKSGEERLNEALSRLREQKGVEIVGSGLAPVERIANRWRFFILIRGSKKVELLSALYKIYQRGVEIDMDPVDFS
ncbi:MAG: primosomal protein N' [Epsilonproteobacteria bacterium]|nr:primosomal protein N' [Campylobacterota bacterium]